MKATHTTGPWVIQSENQYNPPVVRSVGSGLQVAEVFGDGRATRAANASLIASAPELLAALEKFMVSWNDETGARMERLFGTFAVNRARAAIVKAKGGQL